MSCCDKEKKDLETIRKSLLRMNTQLMIYEEYYNAQQAVLDEINAKLTGAVGGTVSAASGLFALLAQEQLNLSKNALTAAQQAYDVIQQTILALEAQLAGATTAAARSDLQRQILAAEAAASTALYEVIALEGTVASASALLESAIAGASYIGVGVAGLFAVYWIAVATAEFWSRMADALREKIRPIQQNAQAAANALANCQNNSATCAKCGKCVAKSALKGCKGCGGGFCPGCFSQFVEQQELKGRGKKKKAA